MTGLVVDADRMRANLERTGGLIYTSARAARAGRDGAVARGRLRARAARGDGHLGDRRAVPRDAAEEAAAAGLELDEARLDAVCRPERYLERLAPASSTALAALR